MTLKFYHYIYIRIKYTIEKQKEVFHIHLQNYDGTFSSSQIKLIDVTQFCRYGQTSIRNRKKHFILSMSSLGITHLLQTCLKLVKFTQFCKKYKLNKIRLARLSVANSIIYKTIIIIQLNNIVVLTISQMNLSARFKHPNNQHRKQPNYILNVNINIPLRSQNILDSYRPLAGEFTFSPSQRSKRLKLQVASARTTHECESRKVSYLGETQNTISHRNNNPALTNPSSRRRIVTKSAFPSTQIIPKQQITVLNKKLKSQSRSHAVSPNGHSNTAKKVSKRQKILTHNNPANINNKSQQLTRINNFTDPHSNSKQLIDLQHYIEHQQIDDNIIGYTNQSSQLGRDRLSRTNNSMRNYDTHAVKQNHKLDVTFQDKCQYKNAAAKITYKAQSPMLEQQRLLIHDIREIQKTVQVKKQHLNYQYLKSKILVLASVKKIQRAWRNYTTRKLIKSYSNNISLKFTNKMKSELSMLVKGQQSKLNADQGKVLTVRSCGYGHMGNQMKRDVKRNLSQLYPKQQKQQQEEFSQIDTQSAKVKKQQNKSKKSLKKQQKSAKSAIVKFQMEQIQRWEELIKHIKQGKKVEEVLQKSFRRKQQLEKQLSNNLKDIGSSENSEISVAQNQEHYKLELVDKLSEQNVNFNKDKYVNQIGEVSLSSSENSAHEKVQLSKEPPNLLVKEKKLKPVSLPLDQIKRTQRIYDNQVEEQEEASDEQQQQQDDDLEQGNLHNGSYSQDNQEQFDEEGATTKRRRKKLQYFENQIRKIDNELSEENASYTESSQYQLSPENVHIRQFNQAYEKQESEKLKKKLQALNKIELFNTKLLEQSELLNNNAYLYTNLQQSGPKKQVQTNTGHKKSIGHQKQDEEQQNAYFIPLTLNNQINQNKKKRINKEVVEQNDGPLQTFRHRNFSDSSNRLYQDFEANRLRRARKSKLKQSEKDQLANKIEQELLFDLLLEVSQNEQIILKMQKLYEKPEGICTNLESIKDYLENFVAFVFEQQSLILVESFNQPKGPASLSLLKTFRNSSDEALNHVSPVLSQHLFNQHWDYASQQIYFDAKYPNDNAKQQERVRYLKSITKMYFKAIFDGFNQSLKMYRVYGQQGKPYPWETNLRKHTAHLTLQQIKPLIRLGYRKLSQIAVIYCGLLFEDKKHSMSQKMIQDIQKQRLDTLVEIELEQDQHNWENLQIETAEVYYRISQIVTQILVLEVCEQMKGQIR